MTRKCLAKSSGQWRMSWYYHVLYEWTHSTSVILETRRERNTCSLFLRIWPASGSHGLFAAWMADVRGGPSWIMSFEMLCIRSQLGCFGIPPRTTVRIKWTLAVPPSSAIGTAERPPRISTRSPHPSRVGPAAQWQWKLYQDALLFLHSPNNGIVLFLFIFNIQSTSHSQHLCRINYRLFNPVA